MIYASFQLIPKDKYLFAVSGGTDSISAAAWLKNIGKRDFDIIHINNHLEPSDELAAAKVEKFAKYLNCKLYLVESNDIYITGSIEAWARDERLQAYNLVARSYGYKAILTAHGLHDVRTGYILNCLKGCGEFHPCPPKTEFANYNLIRPFLNTDKEDFIEYAKLNNLNRFIEEDSLNQDISCMRNWVRINVLPELMMKTNLNKVVRKKFLINK